jgi:cell division transport system permease protein
VRRLGYVLRAAWQGFWRNPVMSMASTLTVALMLLLFAFFVVTDRGLQAAVAALESKVELAVYLEDDALVSDVLALKARLERDPAVAAVAYVSKDEALARLRELADRRADLGPIDDIGTNPLPASLEVKLASAQEGPRLAAALREEQGRGVIQENGVVDNPQVVEKLLTITRVLSFGGLAVLGMMLFVALFVIVNTIRIAVHARRDEIEIMKLVGATDWFVRWPFILEGMLVGVLGAAVSLVALGAAAGPVTAALVGFLDILPVQLGPAFMAQLVGGVVGFALLVGAGGATLSVRAHLAK